MKMLKTLAKSLFAVSLMAAPAAFAAEPMKMDSMNKDSMKMMDMDTFMTSCDMDHDGMMSKAEMQTHMDKMFDKMDTKKTGKLDKKQTAAFLKQFTKESGA